MASALATSYRFSKIDYPAAWNFGKFSTYFITLPPKNGQFGSIFRIVVV